MSSQTPPNPWFNTINYNPAFFSSASGGTVTLSYVNSNFLRITSGSNPISSATTTTFTGQLIATASSSSVISNANNVAMIPISTGIIYLTGVTAFTTSNYPLITDSLGHISFLTGTNSLNVGISGSANGNLNLYGTGGTLTIPASTGTAISVPNGNISAATLTTTGNLLLSNVNPTINTTTLAAPLNISTMTGGTGYINFYPQNTFTFQVAANGCSFIKTCDFGAGLTMSAGAANFNTSTVTCGPLTASSVYIGTNTDTTGQAEIRLYPSIWMDTVTANTWRFYNNNGIGQYIFYNNNVANMAISGTAITNFVNLTLPTVYSAVPTTAQLGGTILSTFTSAQTISTGVFKSLGSITTPTGGTYIINLSVSIVATAAVVLSRHVIEASPSSTVFNNNISQQQAYESISMVSTNGQVYTTSYTIQVTTSTTIFGNVLLAFTGTMTGTGLMTYTRIA